MNNILYNVFIDIMVIYFTNTYNTEGWINLH